jgi:hypothetical protein
MKNKLKFLAVLALLSVGFANAQVGVGTTTPDASAVLDVSSTTRGLLLPRLTTTNRNAITLPATGLVIFNTTSNQVESNTGTPAVPVWMALGGSPNEVILNANTLIPTYAGNETVILDSNSGAHQFTLPNPANYTNRTIYYRNNSQVPGPAGTATFQTYVPINNPTALTGRGLVMVSTGSVWYVVGGN